MANLLDRVIFKPASSGTGNFVVSTAVAGYQTPAAAGAVNATVYYYAAESADKSQWEVGSGAYTVGTTTLARTNIYFNSLGTTAAINFTVAPNVMVTLLNETPLGGAPGGSSGQLEYNAAGSFGGMAGSVVDNTNQTLTLASIANPAAPTLTLTGGTALTTSQPVLNMTQTWNAAGITFTGAQLTIAPTAYTAGSSALKIGLGTIATTAVGLNISGTFSGTSFGAPLLVNMANGGMTLASSYLLDLQLGGATQFRVNADGLIDVGSSNSNLVLISLRGSSVVQANATQFRLPQNSQALQFGSSGDLILGRPAAATLQHGAADAAAPVAQTIQVQSVIAGTSNTAGVAWTLIGSKGTGTGAGGSIIFQTAPAGTTGTSQNAAITALTLDSTQLGNFAGYIHWAGQSRVTSDFSVTSSAVLVNVTGLTANVAAGRTYYFEVYLSCTCAAAGGVKAAIAGTATATNIIYDGFVLDSNTTKGQANSTALAGTVASSTTTATTGLVIQIQGTITVANAGTLTVQFAQNTSNGTASVVKRGSWFEVDDIQ